MAMLHKAIETCWRSSTTAPDRIVIHGYLTKGVQVALLLLFFHKRLCGQSPTAAFIIAPIQNIDRRAVSKSRITVSTKPSRTSSIC
jgi:hypothetical protein